ncbi:MAG: hypothetical protein IPP44_30650 [Ideonella sp.]|nr:hypothetical protein [Ideonella sp.]
MRHLIRLGSTGSRHLARQIHRPLGMARADKIDLVLAQRAAGHAIGQHAHELCLGLLGR